MSASFLKRHADFFVYCVFGAMATAVNMGSYEILYRIMGLANVPSVALSWALAVTFAFFTNKFIVFRKKDGNGQDKGLAAQLAWFYLCRLASGGLDVIVMFIAVDLMGWNHTLWKFISNLLVGLCNYLAGRLYIFRSR